MTLTGPTLTQVEQRTISLTIDGRTVEVPEGTTIWQAARDLGIDIPTLCHDERYDPVGVCRMCVVDVGGRADAAACIRPCEDGMSVATSTPEIEDRRRVLAELLLADQPPRAEDPKQTTTGDNELLSVADRFGITARRARDGQPLWHQPLTAPCEGPPTSAMRSARIEKVRSVEWLSVNTIS